MTYRWKEHVGPADDFQAGYRSYEEARPWVEGDQVKRIGEMIAPEVHARIEKEIEAEIAEAFAFAEASPFPEPSELFTDVFA
jgi:TPP-dependent pyruvate/acetoin dehydrogenase alpha subunit